MSRARHVTTWTNGPLSRRRLLGYGLAGATLWTLGRGATPVFGQTPATQPALPHTWLLGSADELRPPSAGEPASAELDELMRMQALRGAHTNNQIRRWG